MDSDLQELFNELDAQDSANNDTDLQEVFNDTEQQGLFNELAAQEKKATDDAMAEMLKGGIISQAVDNLMPSALNLAGDLANTVMHPIDTATGIYDLGSGVVSKIGGFDWEEEATADAVGKHYSDRYGSPSAIGNSISNDPVGVWADVAGAVGMLPAKLGKVGKVGAIARGLDPANLVTNAAIGGGTVAAKYAQNLGAISKHKPTNLMESALKFSTAKYTPEQRTQMVQTLLDGEYMPTKKGVDALNDRVNTINNEIDTSIDSIPELENMTPREDLLSNIPAVMNDFAGSSHAFPEVNRKAINSVQDRFMAQPETEFMEAANVAPALTPRAVQDLKKNLYQDIKWDSSNMKDKPLAENEAMRAIAQSAKERVEQLTPNVKDLNKELGALLEVRDPFNQSTNRISNRDVMGIGIPIKATVGGVTGGAGGALLGGLVGAVDTPTFKPRIANRLNKMGKRSFGDTLFDNSSRTGIVAREVVGVLEELDREGLLSD